MIQCKSWHLEHSVLFVCFLTCYLALYFPSNARFRFQFYSVQINPKDVFTPSDCDVANSILLVMSQKNRTGSSWKEMGHY